MKWFLSLFFETTSNSNRVWYKMNFYGNSKKQRIVYWNAYLGKS